MTGVFDNILTAHDADNYPIHICYGDMPSKDQIRDDLLQSDIARYLIPAPFDPDSELYQSTDGAITEVMAFMVVFCNTPKETVQGLHNWFLRVGYKTVNNVVGDPPTVPWTYSTLSLMAWHPVGGVESYAEQYGDVWAIEQFVRINIVV